MRINKITLITDYGDGFGCGHLQRMLNLAWYLNNRAIKVTISIPTIPLNVPAGMQSFLSTMIDPDSDLIIRDKRDSTVSEIKALNKIAPVLVLDDLGKGAGIADFKINLLPNLHGIKTDTEVLDSFIYGYAFTQSIKDIPLLRINKINDVAVYAGYNPDPGYIDYILSIIPSRFRSTILTDLNTLQYNRGNIQTENSNSFAMNLLSSKVLVTHFGITLFEGYIGNCRLITINPTEYHSKLTGTVQEKMKIINLGVYQSIEADKAPLLITESIENPITGSINPADVYNTININLANFYHMLTSLPG